MKIEQMIEQHKQMWAAFEKLNQKIEEKQAPYEPKEGEYYVLEAFEQKWISILNNIGNIDYIDHVSYNVGYDILSSPSTTAKSHKLRPATPEEKQLLDDKLKEQGKRWNAEKKCIEDIPTWKVGDWFIPHKPKENKHPFWINDMDKYDNKPLQVKHLIKMDDIDILGSVFNFHPDWCEKTEEPKKEPKIGDMCIFWVDDKSLAIVGVLKEIYGGKDFNFKTREGMVYNNCIPFESIEQYKKFINEEC